MIGEILTPRLRIEPWSESDAKAFYELTRDDGFHAFPITIYRQTGVEAARQWLREAQTLRERTGLGKLAIREQRGGVLIGMGGLTPWSLGGERLVDLTYRFRSSVWGRGYGTEAAIAIAEHAFIHCGLAKITATITPDNTASAKIALRLGMKLDRRIQLKGVPTDLYRLAASAFTLSARG